MKILKAFFFSHDKFCPPYLWVTVLMICALTMIIMRLCDQSHISDTLIIGVLGFVAVWLGLYNWDRKNNGNDYPPPPIYNNIPGGVQNEIIVDQNKPDIR